MVRTWFEVQTRSVSGKAVSAIAEEFIEDGKPKRFRTLMEANEALRGYVSRTNYEISTGKRLPEHKCTASEFKLVPVIEIDEAIA
jgi:hypothetical protein